MCHAKHITRMMQIPTATDFTHCLCILYKKFKNSNVTKSSKTVMFEPTVTAKCVY